MDQNQGQAVCRSARRAVEAWYHPVAKSSTRGVQLSPGSCGGGGGGGDSGLHPRPKSLSNRASVLASPPHMARKSGTSGNRVLPVVCNRQDSTRKAYRGWGKMEPTNKTLLVPNPSWAMGRVRRRRPLPRA